MHRKEIADILYLICVPATAGYALGAGAIVLVSGNPGLGLLGIILGCALLPLEIMWMKHYRSK